LLFNIEGDLGAKIKRGYYSSPFSKKPFLLIEQILYAKLNAPGS
jgi:hypothetical protein